MLVNGHKGQRVGRARKLTTRTISLEEQIEMKWQNNVRSMLAWIKGTIFLNKRKYDHHIRNCNISRKMAEMQHDFSFLLQFEFGGLLVGWYLQTMLYQIV